MQHKVLVVVNTIKGTRAMNSAYKSVPSTESVFTTAKTNSVRKKNIEKKSYKKK